MRLLMPAQVCLLALIGLFLGGSDRPAHALPAAGSDVLPVVATADVVSPLGKEALVMTGRARIDREAPHLDGGVEVVAAEIVSLDLLGASQLGLVSVGERPNDGLSYTSSGELRSLLAEQNFPASGFFDLFVDVALPASPLGSLELHNESALRLTPIEAGQEVPLRGWPPLGVSYELTALPGPDQAPACIPLVSAAGTQLEADYCIRNFTLQFAPERPSYSVARDGPSGLHPADILALTPLAGAASSDQAPFVRIACLDLGLSDDGCDGGADGDQDDLDALSYGDDLPPDARPRLTFSVGAGSQGAPGSAVETQRNCPPTLPGTSPEPEPDQFGSFLNGTNFQVLDGNGPVGACSSAFPLGLIESATVRDDLDALNRGDSSAVDQNADGVPDGPIYFSLDDASPSLSTLDASAADVLKTLVSGTPSLYASAAVLGLQEGDDIDALCLRESGDGAYGPDDLLYFSLAPESRTLGMTGAGPGDLLAPGRPPAIAQPGTSLGLLATDDVNALTCEGLKDADADTDGDTIPNGSDPDDDNDGCTDSQELGSDARRGGLRQPHNFWDFFDTPNEANQRDGVINLVDIFRVAARFGALGDPSIDPRSAPPPAPAYHTAFDRALAAEAEGASSLNIEAPDGAIGSSDIFVIAAQFGHVCP